MPGFICELCRKVFTVNRNLRRHIRLCHDEPSTSFKCIPCNEYFSNQLNYQQHTLQHSKLGYGTETIDTVNCTNSNQMLINLTVLIKFEMMIMV